MNMPQVPQSVPNWDLLFDRLPRHGLSVLGVVVGVGVNAALIREARRRALAGERILFIEPNKALVAQTTHRLTHEGAILTNVSAAYVARQLRDDFLQRRFAGGFVAVVSASQLRTKETLGPLSEISWDLILAVPGPVTPATARWINVLANACTRMTLALNHSALTDFFLTTPGEMPEVQHLEEVGISIKASAPSLVDEVLVDQDEEELALRRDAAELFAEIGVQTKGFYSRPLLAFILAEYAELFFEDARLDPDNRLLEPNPDEDALEWWGDALNSARDALDWRTELTELDSFVRASQQLAIGPWQLLLEAGQRCSSSQSLVDRAWALSDRLDDLNADPMLVAVEALLNEGSEHSTTGILVLVSFRLEVPYVKSFLQAHRLDADAELPKGLGRHIQGVRIQSLDSLDDWDVEVPLHKLIVWPQFRREEEIEVDRFRVALGVPSSKFLRPL